MSKVVTSSLLIVAALAAGACSTEADSTRATGRLDARAPGSSSAPPSPPAPSASSVPLGLSGHLVFQSDRNGRPKIFTLDLAGGAVRQLTQGADHRDEEPEWSPDGRRIAFGSNRGTKGPLDIYVMDADGGNVIRLTDHPANEEDPSWLPDGKSLVFAGERDGRGELYRVWLDDRRVERLTQSIDRAITPSVSPDGRTVAYAAQTIMNYQVHLLDMETRTTRRVTSGSGGACRPGWSLDGKTLAFVSLETEPSKLDVLDLASGTRRTLVRDPRLWSYYPSWTGDPSFIAFSVSPAHHQGEDWDLALVDVRDPLRLVRLTNGPGNDRVPDWKP